MSEIIPLTTAHLRILRDDISTVRADVTTLRAEVKVGFKTCANVLAGWSSQYSD